MDASVALPLHPSWAGKVLAASLFLPKHQCDITLTASSSKKSHWTLLKDFQILTEEPTNRAGPLPHTRHKPSPDLIQIPDNVLNLKLHPSLTAVAPLGTHIDQDTHLTGLPPPWLASGCRSHRAS